MDFTEVDLSLRPGQMGLRHEHRLRADARVPPDLRPPVPLAGADHRMGDVVGVVLLHQPVEAPLSGAPLLGRRVEICLWDPVDLRLAGIQP